MAREIHHTLAQGLTGILFQLEAATDTLTESPEETGERLSRARELAKGSLDEARRSVWALRSEALESRDLPAALTRIAEQMLAGKPVALEVTTVGKPRNLPPDVEGELFRIAQEAVWNAVKYAQAGRIDVTVGADRKRAWVSVRDDGRGFDPDTAVSTEGGFGLGGMRQRAEGLGGHVTVESRPGEGTTVTAEVPLKGKR